MELKNDIKMISSRSRVHRMIVPCIVQRVELGGKRRFAPQLVLFRLECRRRVYIKFEKEEGMLSQFPKPEVKSLHQVRGEITERSPDLPFRDTLSVRK